MKEVRLGRSMKIDPHDIEIRLQQARRFLMDGHKVQIVQNFRGREMVHRDRGDKRMKDIIERLSDVAKVETPPRMAGRRMTMIFAPDKPKIDRIKRQKAEERRATDQQAPEEGAADAPPIESVADAPPIESAAEAPPVESAGDSPPAPSPPEKSRTEPASA